MADTTFTILGTTGSGKTCYLLGMYYEMCAGKEGYTLTTDDDRDVRLQRLYDRLSDKSLGADRFPAGTDNMSEYEFNLEYGYEPIMSFKWTDYAGNALRLKNAVKYFADLKKFISSSSSLFICLDGSLLMGNDTRKKIRDVSTKCSRDINKFFSDYKKDNGMLPPTAVLIIKYDKCKNDTTPEEIEEIVRQSFSAFFEKDIGESTSKKILSIIPVSIGLNIDDTDYSGNLEPINIHLPIFFGIYFALNEKIDALLNTKEKTNNIASLKEEIASLTRDISQKEKECDNEKSSFFLWRNDKKIDALEREINLSKKIQKEKSNEKDENYRLLNYINAQLAVSNEYITRLRKELKKIPLVFIDGEKRENFF